MADAELGALVNSDRLPVADLTECPLQRLHHILATATQTRLPGNDPLAAWPELVVLASCSISIFCLPQDYMSFLYKPIIIV